MSLDYSIHRTDPSLIATLCARQHSYDSSEQPHGIVVATERTSRVLRLTSYGSLKSKRLVKVTGNSVRHDY